MKSFKFNVKNNPELSAAIQERAFELGYKWLSVGRQVQCTDMPYLFLYDDGEITYVASYKWFKKQVEHKEATLDDLYRIPKKHTFTFSNGVEVEYKRDYIKALNIDGTSYSLERSRLYDLCPSIEPIDSHKISYPTVKIGCKEFKTHEIEILIDKMSAL